MSGDAKIQSGYFIELKELELKTPRELSVGLIL